MAKKNVLTGVVVALALVLVIIVVLVKTGVLNSVPQKTTAVETVIESAVVVASETNEAGDVEYYTMVTKYIRPKISSHHIYPTKKQTTAATTEPAFIEQTSFVQVTDENGMPMFDENGVPFTEVVTYTVPADSITTTEPTTAYVPKTSSVVVTNVFGKPQKDENGNPVTQVVTVEPPPSTKADIWSENTQSGTDGKFDIKSEISREDDLAQSIVAQLNEDRAAQGLEPLKHATKLKASARTNSMASALPEVYGEGSVSGAYDIETTYGGNSLYKTVFATVKDEAMNPDVKEIGVGVVKYKDVYYTTVIFG